MLVEDLVGLHHAATGLGTEAELAVGVLHRQTSRFVEEAHGLTTRRIREELQGEVPLASQVEANPTGNADALAGGICGPRHGALLNEKPAARPDLQMRPVQQETNPGDPCAQIMPALEYLDPLGKASKAFRTLELESELLIRPVITHPYHRNQR